MLNNKTIIDDIFLCFDSVKVLKGLVKTNNGYQYSIYCSFIDLNTLTYYYKNYNNKTVIYKLDDYNLSLFNIMYYKL